MSVDKMKEEILDVRGMFQASSGFSVIANLINIHTTYIESTHFHPTKIIMSKDQKDGYDSLLKEFAKDMGYDATYNTNLSFRGAEIIVG